MMVSENFDQYNRKLRFNKANKKVNALIDRLDVTIKDIKKDGYLMSSDQLNKIMRNAKDKLKNLTL